MNLQNKTDYNQYFAEFNKDGCEECEAAAIAKLVERAIINKSYYVYYGNEEIVEDWDVIVTFSFAGDPVFGVYLNLDEPICAISTSGGVVQRYL